MTGAPTMTIRGAELKTYIFDRKEIVIQHHPDLGSYATLADLCEVHWCGTPGSVLPQLFEWGSNNNHTRIISEAVAGPGSTLIDLDGTAMETIRALSPSWEVGVRFREWLINAVFSISPHLDHDLSVWATAAQWQAGDGAETGIQLSGCESAEVARAWRWSEELKTWPMTRLQ
jgi:hypothetical protein